MITNLCKAILENLELILELFLVAKNQNLILWARSSAVGLFRPRSLDKLYFAGQSPKNSGKELPD